MTKQWMVGLLFFGWMTAQQVCAETALGLPVEGVQTIVLSNRVGKNQIQFVSTAPMEEIHGTAAGISGALKLNPAQVEAMTGKIEVQVASMETGIERRDEHLHSADWLDAKQFPVIAFEIAGMKDVDVQTDKAKATLVSGVRPAEARQRAQKVLTDVGLADWVSHRPAQLSGGQRQRVAIARALVNNPALVWADEPTGNLDATTSAEVLALMQQLNREQGQTLVIVTHDPQVGELCDRIVQMEDGQIVTPVMAGKGTASP